ncbi:MAG: phosphoribosyl-ATP diphosphatase [Pseudomonadota bacterium]
MSDTLTRLAATIAARAGDDPDVSYTASLLARGTGACARKFGEEAVEAVVAALEADRDALTGEAADVLYHLQVLLQAAGVEWDDVLTRLAAREGTSGHAEKAARG